MVGKIFAIEEFSTYDGPSMRTTVFMKGCPLSCTWCHNPEGQRFETEYIRNPNGCVRCGNCERFGKTENGRLRLTGENILHCPQGLIRQCGTEYTAQALAEKLNRNAEILRAFGGGVTFSGGEPLCATDFIVETVGLLEKGLSVALQTSGFASEQTFQKALSVCDYVLFDLKIMDREEFRAFCGADNERILNNYGVLVRSGKAFVTRIPLIPSVTDTDENLTAIARFMAGYGVRYAELLPYNPFAGSKYAQTLRNYEPRFDEKAELNYGKDIFARHGINIKIM